jgi:heme/copper-type cytochrome/quinol oxidase subunit 4
VSSVASLQPAAVVFREEQYFDWRVYTFFALVEVLTGLVLVKGEGWSRDIVLGLVIGLALLMFVIVFFLHMTTEVTPTHVRVWFGWLPTYRRVVPIGTIRSIDVVTYRPIADYGFWGIRTGRDGERALIARGNRGVRLELTDGSRLLIGSQRAEALASTMDRTLRSCM